MTNPDLARRRMINQRIEIPHASPVEAVRVLGAVQSQDEMGAMWALGLRSGANRSEVEQAVNDGAILRVHVMRPTWHFVPAQDAGWMLALTAPRVKAGNAARLRELEITPGVIEQSQEIFRRVLSGGISLTRAEMGAALDAGGVSTRIPQSLVHLLMHAELDQVITSGPRRGKQNTYMLLDERAPNANEAQALIHDPQKAAAALAKRYFTSHGPARLKDFAWWSGLTVGAGRAAVEQAGAALKREEIEGQEVWGPADEPPAPPSPCPRAHLLPNYDEYVVAYADRSAIFDHAYEQLLHMRGGVLNHVVLLDGIVAGSWRREFLKDAVLVTVMPLAPLSVAEKAAVEQAAARYGEYWGMPVRLEVQVAQVGFGGR